MALWTGAQAAGPEVWSALYTGRLLASADGDHAAAVAAYEAVLEHLPEDDPQRAELLYWLGRSELDAGRPQAAWPHLVDASESSDDEIREAARKLLAGLLLAEARVTSLPLATSFDDGRSPFVRGWTRGDLKDLRIMKGDARDGAVLAWEVEVQAGEDDFLRAALTNDARALSRLRLRLRSGAFPAQVRILLEDAEGARWTAPVRTVPAGEWLPVELTLNSFSPADAPAAVRRPEPGSIRAVEVRDLTAYLSEQRGQNTLYIDDLDLR